MFVLFVFLFPAHPHRPFEEWNIFLQPWQLAATDLPGYLSPCYRTLLHPLLGGQGEGSQLGLGLGDLLSGSEIADFQKALGTDFNSSINEFMLGATVSGTGERVEAGSWCVVTQDAGRKGGM